MNMIWMGYFLILILLAIAPSKKFLGSKMHLFRAFLPSWKFFDDSDRVPVLQVRIHPDPKGLEKSNWENLMKISSSRPWWKLFHNPEMNYRLATHSLLQQVCQDVMDFSIEESADQFENKPTYQALHHLVQHELQKNMAASSFKKISYQFRILACQPDAQWTIVDDLLVSKNYRLTLQQSQDEEL